MLSDPVETTGIGSRAWSSMRMTDPAPNLRSICAMAESMASERSSDIGFLPAHEALTAPRHGNRGAAPRYSARRAVAVRHGAG